MRVVFIWTAAIIHITPAQLPRLLVFNKVEAGQYVHEVIPDGARAIIALGAANGFDVDSTSNAAAFTTANLARYRAVVFNNTGGEVLNASQQTALEGFIRAGNGYAGFHSACGTEFNWPWYGEMLGGAYFKVHPAIQRARVRVEDGTHLSTRALPAIWERVDEWHDYRANPRAKVHVLLTLDETSYTGGTMGADHPIAWTRAYDGGRAWFSGLGHTRESFSDPLFLSHLLGGIQYAMGMNPSTAIAPRMLVAKRDRASTNPIASRILARNVKGQVVAFPLVLDVVRLKQPGFSR